MSLENPDSFQTNYSFQKSEPLPIQLVSTQKRSDEPDSSILDILLKRGVDINDAIGQRFSVRKASYEPRKMGVVSEITALLLDQVPFKVVLTDYLQVRTRQNERHEIPLNRQRIVDITEANQVR